MQDKVQIRRALISVDNKFGLERLGRRLHARGIEIISTGGTAKALKAEKIPVFEVSNYTGFPEMMEGRLKTLHPKVHGGILAKRNNKEHIALMDEHGMCQIDLVVINLYNFEDPGKMAKTPLEEAVEKIDIGGPAMIRAAVKNYEFVTVVTDTGEYDRLCTMIEEDGCTTLRYRQELMCNAIGLTAQFDTRVEKSFRMRFQLENLPENTTI